jgi:hypothetical protein
MRSAVLGLLLAGWTIPAAAADELATAKAADGQFSYVLTTNEPQSVRYGVILMPGGNGVVDPHLEGGRIVLGMAGNFLMRSRALFAGPRFVAASTDATSSPGRIAAIAADLEKRYGKLEIYVVGTSNSTNATLELAETADGLIAGFVHTSSFNRVASFDPRKLKSRNLLVMHRQDACHFTLPAATQSSHDKFGTELVVMDGGRTEGDVCVARAYHGYNGIERETVDRIESWILNGR